MAVWAPPEVRRNDAWPPSFIEAFQQSQAARAARDFTAFAAHSESRPFDDLFFKHALPHEGDPFKGATERRVSSDHMPTSECDARAAALALEDARVDPRDVGLVVSSALVPDRLTPSNGPAIQHLVGCKSAAGIGVEAVCSSALAQLELASAMVEAGRARFVLCVQSHHLARANDLSIPFSPLFGDASSAFVVGSVPEGRGLVRVQRDGDGSLAGGITFAYKQTPGARWYRDAAGPVHPGTEDLAATRYIGENLLRLPIEAVRNVCDIEGIPIDALGAIAMFQPSVWYQAAVAEGLGVSPDRVPSTYARFAHIGACGVVANLLEARTRGLLRDRSPVVLYAHGAGMTRYVALVRWGS
ncbi:MAG TPA: 3-oxoacyl-[acyl-carrier-protein] synthase III C-terminal domain-containing protein [Polyangiaceae bacterium]|jgi:3-oxoacyl-[acyl-carrier-protein] synthase-3